MIRHMIPKRISSIDFGLMSPDDIRKLSGGTKIITADTYDNDGFPIPLGLMDMHLGVIEPGLRCKTCSQKLDECPGHFGHIDFALPVIHAGYNKNIKDVLASTCAAPACGRMLLPQERIDTYTSQIRAIQESEAGTTVTMQEFIRRAIRETVKQKTCPHCNERKIKLTLDKPTTFREGGHKLTPRDVRSRLEKIPDGDLWPLGFNPETTRPEYMVLTVLPVPPVSVRPTITLESGERSEDDLTHKLVDVLRINQRLRENRDAGAPQLIIDDLWELLQYHITTYFDNQTAGIPTARHRSGRPLKTIIQRLKGKEGRFRSNLSGKRVNFSARTVITPDPYLSINQVGVPEMAARELTIPVRVNIHNLQFMKWLMKENFEPTDAERYIPGINYMVRPDGRRVKLSEENWEFNQERLEPGYIVERHLMDGDIVLFNRQPSLHRMSMMAHEVRIMKGKTFRINLCVCPPYNADFDGDEMNLHVVQSEEARAEARILMRVQEHIRSPRFGGAVIGAIHDHITGMFLLTHGDANYDHDQTVRILSRIDFQGTLPKPAWPKTADGPRWSGRQIFSALLPDDMNLKFNASVFFADRSEKENAELDTIVEIKNGEMLRGPVDGRSISAFKGIILEEISRLKGPTEARKFIDRVTRLAVGALMETGCTTGIDDEDIPAEASLQISDAMEEAMTGVDKLAAAYNKGKLERRPGRSLEETLEVEVMKKLGEARDRAGEIAGWHLGMDNFAVIMARSGARGSMLNLSQMAGSIGQQAIRGERVSRGYNKRTLSHFNKNDLGAEAKGFVRSSYKQGLNPTEYFFHSMGGREGLVDTAVRTSRSGYMQRRLVNALEDLRVKYDGTVRNTANTVVQFRYGGDGIDPTRSKDGKGVDVEGIVSAVAGGNT
ncbi:MAG: DNA-directed RNA polymerase subunit A' [Candidatus Poseidoniia archaeon]|nr:DNA-directed RNA polymerase subunit A' [Euryarchaeota archaeon]MDP6489600.1 DNA-directed RNA polymerase subunit A' [Candidatus Poseidoniia archaeon]MDP6534123.1 DNA-directed RNA polymerase subunit A' [Candidatus Poseidoniia archaeon]MDP6834843.1 DNA-directed RNA polymerase subunit A' [Candidatus Poseidoniia archaeon]HIH79158.1 DNA-directed RNA polymerase subunit A' [Candidatus Poseidoniia archaeon]